MNIFTVVFIRTIVSVIITCIIAMLDFSCCYHYFYCHYYHDCCDKGVSTMFLAELARPDQRHVSWEFRGAWRLDASGTPRHTPDPAFSKCDNPCYGHPPNGTLILGNSHPCLNYVTPISNFTVHLLFNFNLQHFDNIPNIPKPLLTNVASLFACIAP